MTTTASTFHRWRASAVSALRIVYGLLHGGERRRIAWLTIWPMPRMFQPHGFTALDRYPVVFDCVRRNLPADRPLAILSFGCASGEEVFTLRRYFPKAVLKGLDIDPGQIRRCHAALAASGGDPNISFEVASCADGEGDGAYDAIFAMAVFRHGDLHRRPPSCAAWVRFEDFEATVAGLARALKPGGLLALRHANFRFADTAVSRQFRRILSRRPNETTPAYGRDNRLLADDIPDDGVFQKLRAPGATAAEPSRASETISIGKVIAIRRGSAQVAAGAAAGTVVPGWGNALGFVVGGLVGAGTYYLLDRAVPRPDPTPQ